MKIEVKNTCKNYNTYRAARVKSLFNAERGDTFTLTADIAVEDIDWQIGLIVGPSGSGKTSIGKQLFGGGTLFWATNGIDNGDICEQEICIINPEVKPRDYYNNVIIPIMERCVNRALTGIANGNIRKLPQIKSF